MARAAIYKFVRQWQTGRIFGRKWQIRMRAAQRKSACHLSLATARQEGESLVTRLQVRCMGALLVGLRAVAFRAFDP